MDRINYGSIGEVYDEINKGVGGGGSNNHVYTLDEQINGEWVDGSAVYEKTIHIDALNAQSAPYNILENEIITGLIGYYGYCEHSNGSAIMPIPYFYGGNNYVIYYDKATHKLELVVNGSNIKDVNVVVRYTKAV